MSKLVRPRDLGAARSPAQRGCHPLRRALRLGRLNRHVQPRGPGVHRQLGLAPLAGRRVAHGLSPASGGSGAGTQRVVWTRGVALAVLALAVFLNAYGNGFFDGHVGDVWKATNPIFPWLHAHCRTNALGTGRPERPSPGPCSWGAQGVVLFINAYFVNNGAIWDALDPLRILTLLVWSGAALARREFRAARRWERREMKLLA